MQPSESSDCGTGSWGFVKLEEKGAHHGEGVSATITAVICAAAGLWFVLLKLTQRMEQNKHKPQNADVRRAGRRWRSSFLSRTLGDVQLSSWLSVLGSFVT